MNHKFALMALATAWITALPAGATDVLIVSDASTAAEFNLANVKTLKFTDESMQVFSANMESPATFALTDKLVIKFGEATGVATLTAGSSTDAKPVYKDGMLTMEGNGRANAALYSTTGQCVRRIANWDGRPVSTEGLAAGVYIFKVNNQSIKFVKH